MRLIDKLYKSQGIQGILTIGYMYIVVLGIIGEALYYSQIGVNILTYSSITDVLLSPISKITSNFYLLIFVSLFIAAIYLMAQSINTDAKRAKFRHVLLKLKLLKSPSSSIADALLVGVASLLFGFYVGLDYGKGMSAAKDLEKGKFKYIDKVYFNNNDSTTHTFIAGSNSSYIFYVDSLNKHVTISPMGAVKSFEKKPRLLLSKLTKKLGIQ